MQNGELKIFGSFWVITRYSSFWFTLAHSVLVKLKIKSGKD